MKTCPFCAEDIKAEAIKCKHCGELVQAAPSRGRSAMRGAAKLLIGVASVYGAVAACAASGITHGSGGAAHHGAGGAGGLLDPVPDARADNSSGSRLKVKERIGEDGSKESVGWFDSQRMEDCSFRTAADGAERCLPSAAPMSAFFSDATCTKPVAQAQTGCPPKYVTVTDGTTCSYQTHISAIGAKLPSSTVYYGSGPSCTATMFPAGYDPYEVGAEIAPSSFVAATTKVSP